MGVAPVAGTSRAEVYKTSRNVTPDNNVSADFQTPEENADPQPPQIGHTGYKSALSGPFIGINL